MPPTADDSPADAEAAALREEVDQLRQALASRGAVIDQAVGIVMALGRLPADEAWHVLREVTQRTNSKLHLVAQLLTAWAESGELHVSIRIALEEAVRGREAREGRPGPLRAG
ncbi:ANTAR domain-containing protein [Streptomyces sp. NBC_00467]